MLSLPLTVGRLQVDAMEDPLSRRRVLEASGVGAALSFAGCNSLRNQDVKGSESGSGDATVTVFADLDQEELESYQAELREQVQSGEMAQQEAQTKARRKQIELMTKSVESFEERAAENDDLEVTDKVTQSGVLLVEGTGEAIVGTLGYEEVHGLLAESEFEQYRQAEGSAQSNQTGQSEQSGETGSNESTDEPDTPEETADSA